MKTIKRIEISGRRWFQKSYGNTYFTAVIEVDDKVVHEIPQEYGYGVGCERRPL